MKSTTRPKFELKFKFNVCPHYLQVLQRFDYRWLRKRGDLVFLIRYQWEISVAMVNTVQFDLPKNTMKPYPHPNDATDKISLKLAKWSWIFLFESVADGRQRTTEAYYTTSLWLCWAKKDKALYCSWQSVENLNDLFVLFTFVFIFEVCTTVEDRKWLGSCDCTVLAMLYIARSVTFCQKKTRVVENMLTRQPYMSFWRVYFYWCKYLE